ncbi:bcl-2-like protein 11 [Danio rerio]|uniref:Bcl-2 interacting mediator of cell death n=1 Tax=Danio rerio TaxID=7955 RepID=B2KKY9_DANRE|nr:bcl-2-like protein 11 [Danio rerio]ABS45110.1 Bcl-2 interacting mediator of cell death [Danio rerio]|eukprot:NP_001129263.1 bcl-2-like protein 11 [Danio rerio]
MSDTSREQTLANGPASQGSGESTGGGVVLPAGHFDFPQPGEGDPLRGGISMSNNQSRSPMNRTFSRSSSGYFSVDSDSVPGSPLMPNISEAQDGQNDEVWLSEHSHQHLQMAAPVAALPPEMVVARELRRIGDEFNRLYCEAGAGVNQLRAPNEHAIVLWMNVIIGRLVHFFLRRR